jgi:hypothetical protein
MRSWSTAVLPGASLHTGNNTQNVTKLRSSPANPALPQRFYLRKRLNSLALQARGTFHANERPGLIPDESLRLGESGLPGPPEDHGPALLDDNDRRNARGGFLRPFKPRADTDYLAQVVGGPARRGRTHETLVNDFAEWLTSRELVVGYNAAIDLGLEHPPVIIEAKVIRAGRWAHAVREAIGQLYEYRYFQVVPPQSSLIFLASTHVPTRWLDYLDRDRRIGAAWRSDDGFALTNRARKALGI